MVPMSGERAAHRVLPCRNAASCSQQENGLRDVPDEVGRAPPEWIYKSCGGSGYQAIPQPAGSVGLGLRLGGRGSRRDVGPRRGLTPPPAKSATSPITRDAPSDRAER